MHVYSNTRGCVLQVVVAEKKLRRAMEAAAVARAMDGPNGSVRHFPAPLSMLTPQTCQMSL